MPKTDLEKIAKASQVTKQGQTLAELEQRLVTEIDGRKEERFIWIVILIILIDFIVIILKPSLLLIFPFALELIILTWLARKLQHEEIVFLIERIWRLFPKVTNKSLKD